MRRLAILPLALLLACPTSGGDEEPGGYQGYDDDDVAPDDDDDVVPADDDDDFTPGETKLDPCETWQLLVDDEACAEVPVAPILLEGAACPEGERTVRNSGAWDYYLRTECSWIGEDPLHDHDWDAEAVLVSSLSGTACSLAQDTMWARVCPDGTHLGHYSYLCGYCEDDQAGVSITPVDPSLLPLILHDCVPYNVRCKV